MRAPLVAGLLLALTLTGCGHSITPPKPTHDDSATRAVAAAATLRALLESLRNGDTSATAGLAAPDHTARADVAAMVRNAHSLRLTDLRLRYLDTDESAVPSATERRYGSRAWTAEVSLRFRIPEYDDGATHYVTRFVFVQDGSAARIASAGGGDHRAPLWLAGPMRTSRTAHTLVMTAGADPARYHRLAVHAVHAVREVLPAWHGPLVVEVPASESELESMLGVSAGTEHAIAGVTTTVDGRDRPGTPVHVFLNPAVYNGLGTRGAQVVLSHEATHVATKAPFADMPTWLMEGFADFVALDHAGVPVKVAAGQILASVRKNGPPKGLPTAADLSPAAPHLGATYEEAWSVCRYLGETYGEKAMVGLYYAVDRGMSLDRAIRVYTGVDRRRFVAGWQADLVELAHR